MKYSGVAIFIIMFSVSAVVAQQNEMTVGSDGVPEGWEYRLDTPDRANLDNLVFTVGDEGIHVNSGGGEAAIFYQSMMTTSGPFSVSGSFTQLEEAGHPTSYGLFVGGENLQDANQHYLYFLVRQTGEYMIRRRNGSETATITDWTSSDAVNTLDSSGQMTNDLEITRGENEVTFSSNGEVLETIPLSELNFVDGIAGLRVTHLVNVRVGDFEVNDM